MADSLTLAAELIKRFEGFRASPYLCPAGKWTIGYGSTFLETGKPVTSDTPDVTEAEATLLLNAKLGPLRSFLKRHVSRKLTAHQEAATLSLIYNIGEGNFLTSTVLKCLKFGAMEKAADAFLLFDKMRDKNGVLVKNNGLENRRKEERAFFLEPDA